MNEHTGIHDAMIAVMTAVDPIAKGKTNQGQGYKFRGIDDVYQALQAIMARHGVFTTSEVKGDPDYTEFPLGKNGTLTFRTRAVFRFTFWHTTGTSVSTEVIGEGMDSGDKASNKSMSVAHKYALLQAFLIPTDDPKDPENDDHEIKAPAKAQLAKQAPNPPATPPAAPPNQTRRQKAVAFLDSKKEEFSEEQWTELQTDLSHAGTTDALLDAIAGKAAKFLKENFEATQAALAAGGLTPEQ